jgi:ubiquinone/menaquinone biosynthesis C-methylase UbiE
MAQKPDYENWVTKRLISVPFAIGLLFLSSTFLFLFLVIPAVLFFLVAAFFAYARYKFSLAGGNVQGHFWELVLAHLDWNGVGQALDIGCGNGALTIKLAQEYPNAQVTGIDYWGSKWEYSKNTCERNAEIEGVSERVTFQKASAVSLPFDGGHFDAVVSNFVFHEVSDAKDKRGVIREAVRVVRKGGAFAFQDEFLVKQFYGNPEDLIDIVKSWGVSKVQFVQTRDADFIPFALRLPLLLGAMAIIAGQK